MASELQFQELIAILRRRKGLILSVAVFGTTLATAGALLIPPRYTAKAQIVFDPHYAARPGEPNAAYNPAEEESVIPTQIATLLSHDQMERVRTSLADDPDYVAAHKAEAARATAADAAWRRTADSIWQQVKPWLSGAWMRPLQPAAAPPRSVQARPAAAASAEAIIPDQLDFERRLKVFQEPGSHVIAVTYMAASPEVAAAVANRAIHFYIEGQTEQKQEATNSELAWLGERIPALKGELERAETKILDYEAAHGYTNINPAAAGDEQLADLSRQLATAEADLEARQGRLDFIHSAPSGGPNSGAFLESLNSPTLVELHRQETDLQQSEAELAVSFGAVHPKLQQVRSRLQDIKQRIATETNRAVRNLQDDAQIAGARVTALRHRLATLQQASTDMRLRDLKYEATVKQQLYSTLVQRQEEVRDQHNALQPDARLLSQASLPDRPSSPNALLFVLPGLIVFLIGGSMLAVLIDQLDRRLRSQRDVDEALGIPCLAIVPKLRRIGRTRPHQSLLANPLGIYAEAIRSVVASLQLAGGHGAPKVVLVSSSVPGEGKTTLAVSLAAYVASLGRRVLLVDLDFRHSSLQRELGGKPEAGVLDLLLRERTPAEVIQHLPELGLHYLPVARRPVDPFALFASNQMRQLLTDLRQDYDCIIVDGPPLLVITEARLLASMVDKVLFVVKWAGTRRDMAQNALNLLRSAGASAAGRNALATLQRNPYALDASRINLAGAVLTQVDLKKHARSHHGDIGESFAIYRKSYIEADR